MQDGIETSTAAERMVFGVSVYRSRERDLSLRIRDEVEREIRTNGLNSVNPAVVTASVVSSP